MAKKDISKKLRTVLHYNYLLAYENNIINIINNSFMDCNFTQHQMDIISLLSLGLSEESIGHKLNISQQSVNTSIQSICNKINNYKDKIIA